MCPYLLSFGRIVQPSSPCTVPIYPARPVWHRVQTGAACPASGRACRCAACCGRSVLHLARPALLPVLYSSPVCAGVGRGAPAGYTVAAQPRPVSRPTTEKIKKAQKITLPPIINSKNFPQKQKDPYKGSAFCAILSLQALKGRNLQWLKVK